MKKRNKKLNDKIVAKNERIDAKLNPLPLISFKDINRHLETKYPKFEIKKSFKEKFTKQGDLTSKVINKSILDFIDVFLVANNSPKDTSFITAMFLKEIITKL